MNGAGENEPKRSRGRFVILGLVLLGGGLAWYFLPGLGRPTPEAAAAMGPETVKAARGPIERTIRLGGVTTARSGANVRVPRQRGGMRGAVLLELADGGQIVREGDVIARIDGRSLEDRVDDLQSNYVSTLANVRKRRAELDVDVENLNHEIRLAESELEKWKAEAGAAEVRTIVDREILGLGVEESEAVYQQRLKDQQYTQVSQDASLRIEEITSQRSKLNLDRNVRDLERYIIRAPMDGMVVREAIFRDGEMMVVRAGDQVRPGQPFLKVIDTTNMAVECNVSQTAGSVLRLGQVAHIGLDAYPEVELTGTITSIGALARNENQGSAYVRWIPISVRIEGSHPKLLPDLSAFADVVLDRREDTIPVPLGAVAEEAGQHYVSVKTAEGFVRRPVTVGLVTNIEAEITSGLEPGEEIAAQYPNQ